MLRKRFEARDQYLIVRLTTKEKARIQRTAKKQKLTASEYIRRLAEAPPDSTLHDIKKSIVDCKYLALSVRDDISEHLVEKSGSTALDTDLSDAQAKISSLDDHLTELATRLSEHF